MYVVCFLSSFSSVPISLVILSKLSLTLLHSERPKLHRVLAVLSAIGLNNILFLIGYIHAFIYSKFILLRRGQI